MSGVCTATAAPLRNRQGPPITCRRPAIHIGQHQGVEHVPEYVTPPELRSPTRDPVRPEYDALLTWSAGGSTSTALLPPEGLAANCMTCARAAHGGRPYGEPHDPGDHAWVECVHCGITFHNLGHTRRDQHPDTRDGWCFTCAEWMSRAIRYADPCTRLVRVHAHSSRLTPARLYGWSRATGAFGGWHVTVTWDDGRTVGPRDSLWDAGAIPPEWDDYFPPNATVETGDIIARRGHTDSNGRPLAYTAHPFAEADA